MKDNNTIDQTNKKRVAIVDDETGITEMYTDILSDKYEIKTFNNPTDVIKYLEQFKGKEAPFDVLMTDFKMPDMTGVDMIRKTQSLGFNLPSLILSGYLDKQTIMDAVDIGVHIFLEKPVQIFKVAVAIEELLAIHEIHETRQEIRQILKTMREYYAFMRLFIANNVPPEKMQELGYQSKDPSGKEEKVCFEDMIYKLETRLEKLLNNEKDLERLLTSKHHNAA